MLKELKEKNPKSYITLLLMLSVGIIFASGSFIYLVVITRYMEEGFHIIYGICAGAALFFLFIFLIHIAVQVNNLQTEPEWTSRKDKLIENKKYELEAAKYEIVLEKLKRNEELDATELNIVKNLQNDVLEKKPEGV